MSTLPAPLSAKKRRIFEGILIIFSLLVGYAFVEIGFRTYLYYSYVIAGEFSGIAIVDFHMPPFAHDLTELGNVMGRYPPNTTFTRTQYDALDRPTNRHEVHSNNLGWISHYDYSATKAPDEYRIAFLGASLTESITNSIPWPDVVQRRLNEDHDLLDRLHVRKISVVNLGLAGAHFQDIVNAEAVVARRFSPDLVVMNFSEFSITLAELDWPFTKIQPEPEAPSVAPPGSAQELEDKRPADLIVDGVEIWLYCNGGEVVSVSNPKCKVHPEWSVAPGRTISSTEFKEIKRHLARIVLLHRVLLSLRPLALLDLLGHPVIPRAHAEEAPGSIADPRISLALKTFGILKAIYPNIMFAYDPLLWDPNDRQPSIALTQLTSLATARGFEVVQLLQYLPVQKGEKEWSRWYIPEGHWSDYGAEVYGEAMYHVLRNRLLASRGISPSEKESACVPAFNHFRDGNAAEANSNKEVALADFNAAVAALPPDAQERSRRAFGLEDCGFVAELFGERSLLLEEQGQTTAAMSDWARLLELAPDPSPYYERRAKLRLVLGNLSGAIADQSELIRTRPNDINLLFGRAQARSTFGDQTGVIADCDRILEMDPRNAGVLFMRAGAKLNVGQTQAALADIDAALKIMPNYEPFLQSRAAILDRLGRHGAAAAER